MSWSAARAGRARRTRSPRRGARRRAASSAGRRARRRVTVIVAARDGREADERPDLDVVGRRRVLAAGEPVDAVDRAACSSRCPRCGRPSRTSMRHRSCTCGSQAALMRRVRARRQHGGHDGVLGAGDARLVEEDARAAQAAGRARGDSRGPSMTIGAERLEREEVRVDAAAADDVAAGRRHVDRARSAPAAGRRAGSRRGCGCRARGRARCARCASARIVELVLRRPRRRRRPGRRPARPSPRRRGCAGRWRARPARRSGAHAARMGRAAFLLPSGADGARRAGRRPR